MSIYGSLPAPDDLDHEDSCERWDKTDPECWEVSGQPCDCGQPDAPLVYQGSHILPDPRYDKRGGTVDLACISGFITRPGRDGGDGNEERVWPYLRFGVNEATVVLTERNVKQIAETLTYWLSLPKIEEAPAKPA